jgi:hypothetical protein
MAEWMNENVLDAVGEAPDPYTKMQRQLINVNKEYQYALSNGYVKAIDAMISYLNNSDISSAVRNKVTLVMTSLLLDDSDVDYLKDSVAGIDSGSAIPSMSEALFINDIPLEFDIIEAVYQYILRIAREAGFYNNGGIFGDINLSGVMFTNNKDLSEVYQSYIIGIDGEIVDSTSTVLAKKITDLCRANNVVRERLMKLVNGGKKPSKKDEVAIRLKYKFDPSTGSLQKRAKPINKVVFAMLAKKSDIVYSELKKLLK